MGSFGGPNMGGMDRNMTSQQVAAMQQMRNNYMNNQNSGPFAPGQNNQNGQMNATNAAMSNAAAMQRYQQMQNSRQQMMNQMRNSSNMMASNMKSSTGISFPPTQQGTMPPNQANFNQNRAAQLAQMQSAGAVAGNSAGGGAKWHTPQQKQASNHGNNSLSMMGMSMSPPATNFINDSFKIPLRSPDTLRNHHQNASAASTANGSTNFPIPLPNVTSSNPKTPSPVQKDAQKDISDSIDMVCNESVVDLLATIAKLDSNGVQVVPEGGRSKATSPQVHSSTDALDPNSISLNDKNNQPKDDPNEDWCAVCMGMFLFENLTDSKFLNLCLIFFCPLIFSNFHKTIVNEIYLRISDGGELMCCDKCPKVFHQACHIPVISSLPDESETWQCLLCFNFADALPGKIFQINFKLSNFKFLIFK